MEFIKLFKSQAILDHDLIILNYSNFLEFLKFLPESELLKFEQYQKLICPQNVQSDEFKVWVTNVISATDIKQSALCETIKISQSKLSSFLNNNSDLSIDQRYRLKSELKNELVVKKLAKA